jgi:Ca-activated chloride channel family protein
MNPEENSSEPAAPQPASPLPVLRLAPRRSALLAGHDNTLDVLVRIQAPDAPAATPARPPLHLALVIDRSGSMSGQPLIEAKRCAEFVLDALQPTDRLSVVAYDDTVQTLAEAAPVGTTREAVRHALRQLDSGGSTDLHGGWLQGVHTLLPHLAAGSVSRVVLLSDGCANAGLCDPQAIWAQCQEFADLGVGTSTYGLGRGFNEDLMIGMARTGHGQSYYGQAAEDLLDPFREEFDLLSSLCARRLRLEVAAPASGVKAKLLNAYAVAGDGAWWLPDLAYAGEAWAVLRLKVPAALLASHEPHLVSIALRYTGVDGKPRAIQPVDLVLPVLSAAAFAAVSEDELVVRRVSELEAAELQQKARRAAMRGEWDAVHSLLQRAERLGAENPWIAATLGELRQLAASRDDVMFAKQSAYSALRMSTRLAARDEAPELAPRPAASYLRRKANPGKGEDGPESRPRH